MMMMFQTSFHYPSYNDQTQQCHLGFHMSFRSSFLFSPLPFLCYFWQVFLPAAGSVYAFGLFFQLKSPTELLVLKFSALHHPF